MNSVHFRDTTTGWVAGTQVILKTTNGGTNWTDKYTGGGVLHGIYFVSATNGWAVGASGVIAKSTNAGETWTESFPTTAILNGVFAIDTNTAWIAGNQVIFKTTNGGTNWTDKYNGGAALNSVHFPSSTIGWAVGNTGTIAKSTNAGETWTESFPTTATLNGVYFTSTTTGFACGSQVIFKTTNGGTNWTDKYTGGGDLQSVHFLNANEGWAVGSNGTIVKSTNAGETWVEQVHPTTTTLESVVFVTPPMVSVTVQTSPTGRSFSVDGTSYTTAQTFSWVSGSSHTIATTSPQAGATGTQYVWSNWSDGGAISHTVAPTSATTYTANFTTQYFLTMTAGSGGTVSPSSGYRNAGSSVSISATPNSGFTFTGWTGTGSGSYTGTNNPANVTMNAPITETAAFAANISVTVQTSPTGRSFSVDGTSYTTAQTFSWVPGSTHTIATTSPQAGATGTQYVWSNWSDGGAISHTVAPTVGTTYTANFTTQYFLTMTAGSGGTVSPASGYRNAGSSVSISATPNGGFSFAGWTGTGSGSYTGSSNPANVTMNAPISETAAFSSATVAVTVQATLGASFRVDGVGYDTPQAFVWATGSVHTVGADSIQVAPGGDERLVWQSWSDAGALEHSVTASSDATITATFAREYALTMAVQGMGAVTPGSGWIGELVDVTIEAVADSGWAFVNWIGIGARFVHRHRESGGDQRGRPRVPDGGLPVGGDGRRRIVRPPPSGATRSVHSIGAARRGFRSGAGTPARGHREARDVHGHRAALARRIALDPVRRLAYPTRRQRRRPHRRIAQRRLLRARVSGQRERDTEAGRDPVSPISTKYLRAPSREASFEPRGSEFRFLADQISLLPVE